VGANQNYSMACAAHESGAVQRAPELAASRVVVVALRPTGLSQSSGTMSGSHDATTMLASLTKALHRFWHPSVSPAEKAALGMYWCSVTKQGRTHPAMMRWALTRLCCDACTVVTEVQLSQFCALPDVLTIASQLVHSRCVVAVVAFSGCCVYARVHGCMRLDVPALTHFDVLM